MSLLLKRQAVEIYGSSGFHQQVAKLIGQPTVYLRMAEIGKMITLKIKLAASS
jgi:hypothetical protein